MAQEGLDEGVEFGVLLAAENRGTGLWFFLERGFRVGFLELGIKARAEVLQLESEFGYMCALFGCHCGKFFVGVALGTDDFGRHPADFSERAHVGEFGPLRGRSVKIARMGNFIGLLNADFEDRAVGCAILLLAHDNSAVFLKFSVHFRHGGM